jgi:hypothetical protein
MALRHRGVHIRERVENLASHDRPIGWTQHVTLGPPFLEPGATEFRASATRSQVYSGTFGENDHLRPGAVFDWPAAPRFDGSLEDLRRFTSAARSSAYTTHLMDPQSPHAFFLAFSLRFGLAFGYVWKRADFPWLGIWEENRSRKHSPWNGGSIARGMEFGVSPFPETRRQMIERGVHFGTPAFGWIPAHGQVQTEYWALVEPAPAVPDSLAWPEV